MHRLRNARCQWRQEELPPPVQPTYAAAPDDSRSGVDKRVPPRRTTPNTWYSMPHPWQDSAKRMPPRAREATLARRRVTAGSPSLSRTTPLHGGTESVQPTPRQARTRVGTSYEPEGGAHCQQTESQSRQPCNRHPAGSGETDRRMIPTSTPRTECNVQAPQVERWLNEVKTRQGGAVLSLWLTERMGVGRQFEASMYTETQRRERQGGIGAGGHPP